MKVKKDNFLIFSERLKFLRESNNLTQKELSIELKRINSINISEDMISAFERGISEPKLSQIIMICTFFDVSPNFLLGYTQSLSLDPLSKNDNHLSLLLASNNFSVKDSINLLDLLSTYMKGLS